MRGRWGGGGTFQGLRDALTHIARLPAQTRNAGEPGKRAGFDAPKKKERVPWNALFGIGVAVLARRHSLRTCSEPTPDTAHVNGVQFVAFEPEARWPSLLTSGSRLGAFFARICDPSVLLVATTLPSAHSLVCMSFTL